MSYRRIKVQVERDVLIAASTAATMAQKIGLSFTDCARVETSVSELARNLLVHANGGTLELKVVSWLQRTGLQVCAADLGPGIVNVSQALQDGFTTQSTLGIGLGVAKRMMDDFSICSHPGWGTSITAVKWNR
jgi:serine/threonine-protein kinase RsbT